MFNKWGPGSYKPLTQGQKQGHGDSKADNDIDELLKRKFKVDFPDHLYPPEDVQTVDMRNLFDVDPGVTVDVVRITCPEGAIIRVLKYGVFNDGLLAADFDFFPTVNGRRIYPYHGDPLDNFRIYLGVAPDLSNSSLFEGLLNLYPGQTLLWQAQNRSLVTTTMGVRVYGYLDRSQTRTQGRFGG